MPHVYMLRCSDGSFYVGSTRDLERRVWEHQEGLGAAYTRHRRPVVLVWQAEYPNVGEAFFWEKRIQNWSRAKREALINGEYDRLPELAKKRFDAPARRGSERSGAASVSDRTSIDPLGRLRAMTRPPEVVAVTDAFLRMVDSPGLVRGLYLHGSLCWGEFFPDSDIDFVAVLDHAPTSGDLAVLDAAHARLRDQFPHRRYEGFYCQPGDLARPPAELGPVPVHYEGAFSRAGRLDVNPVTWHELAERGHVVRGSLPTIHVDLDQLLDFTRQNLDAYWAPMLDGIGKTDDAELGADADAVVWIALGVARLHHLLATRALTSKSGAGRYVLEALDPRWHLLAAEALRLRERQAPESHYDDPAALGRDLRAFLAWTIADGRRLR
jgi:predicted GIY-YIG superfamily endonuclease